MRNVVLDLCGGTGSWSRPYREAGYQVDLITLPAYDVTRVEFGTHAMHFEQMDVHYRETHTVVYSDLVGILAAPPVYRIQHRQGSASTRPRGGHGDGNGLHEDNPRGADSHPPRLLGFGEPARTAPPLPWSAALHLRAMAIRRRPRQGDRCMGIFQPPNPDAQRKARPAHQPQGAHPRGGVEPMRIPTRIRGVHQAVSRRRPSSGGASDNPSRFCGRVLPGKQPGARERRQSQ